MRLVAADAIGQGADTLITSGAVQSNHARVTAAAAAKLGLHAVIVANGVPPDVPTANALLDRLLGAEVRYVGTRPERASEMQRVADGIRARGGRPYVIPIGASTPLGAAAFVHAIDEMLDQIDPPNVIIHSTSSGGTQAGLVAGCALAGISTRVIGISADESRADLERQVRAILSGLATRVGVPAARFDPTGVEGDDRFGGKGYGIPTQASRDAIELTARNEALFLDPTYTSKAMAGLMARVRAGEFKREETILFWHTGGQVGLFA